MTGLNWWVKTWSTRLKGSVFDAPDWISVSLEVIVHPRVCSINIQVIPVESAVLRAAPQANANVIDTIFDEYNNLAFVVLIANSTNNFVKVKILMENTSMESLISKKGMLILPNIINDGKEGWILSTELLKYPIPTEFLLPVYQNDENLLFTIIDNALGLSVSNKSLYNTNYRGEHACCYFTLGQQYYEKDSLKKAIYYLTKSIQIAPKSTAYVIRTLAKIGVEDYQSAISDCNKGLLLRSASKKMKMPVEGYLGSIDLKYDNIDLIGLRGYCYYKLKKYNLAIIDLNAAIKNNVAIIFFI